MAPPILTHQRCLHHAEREAVARCPECGGYFCRECIVEHEDRVICAACLKKVARKSETKRIRFAGIFRSLQFAFGIFTAWLFFYFAGRLLLTIPASFHDGTLWHQDESE